MTEAIWRIPDMDTVIARLSDPKTPVTDRINAIFAAREHGDEPCVAAMKVGLDAEEPEGASVLVRHEIAYNLGQCGVKSAVAILESLVESEREDEVTRHEAIEGLAALDHFESLPLLRKLTTHPSVPLAQTALLAVRSLEIKHPEVAEQEHEGPDVGVCACQTGGRPIKGADQSRQAMYRSVDPMEPSEELLAESIDNLRTDLLNEEIPLWRRYQCLFALRDKEDGGEAAVKAVCEVMRKNKDSAVLRHEAAYVLGQLMDRSATDALRECLADENEHPMARHEAALSLGSIASGAAIQILNQFCRHPEPMVSESCLVGLDYMGKKPEPIEGEEQA